MNIKEALIEEHSKRQAVRIAKYVGNDAERFAELIHIIQTEEYRFVQRGSWVVRHCFDEHPELIEPHLDALVEQLRRPNQDAFRRNVLAILASIKIPKRHIEVLADLCFGFLASRKEPVAIRAHSMEVLYQVCTHEPELSNELKLLIEEFMPHETAGFKSKGKKIIARLAKLTS